MFHLSLHPGFYIDEPQPTSYHYRNDPTPRPLSVSDRCKQGESWTQWSFTAPRLKGSAVTANFTLIVQADGARRGFADFKGRSRSALFDIHDTTLVSVSTDPAPGTAGTMAGTAGTMAPNGSTDSSIDRSVHAATAPTTTATATATTTATTTTTSFWLDTWMSRTEPRIQLHPNGSLTGILRVGNAQYPMSGRRLAGSVDCAAQPPKAPVARLALTPEEESTILGGEMTLWSELVTEPQLDQRMWPRGYAIAERLWSAASLTDEDSMYTRMAAVGEWGTQSVGLLQDWDQVI
jgi:hypothetical protein